MGMPNIQPASSETIRKARKAFVLPHVINNTSNTIQKAIMNNVMNKK
jgi:hypothetical protein